MVRNEKRRKGNEIHFSETVCKSSWYSYYLNSPRYTWTPKPRKTGQSPTSVLLGFSSERGLPGTGLLFLHSQLCPAKKCPWKAHCKLSWEGRIVRMISAHMLGNWRVPGKGRTGAEKPASPRTPERGAMGEKRWAALA